MLYCGYLFFDLFGLYPLQCFYCGTEKEFDDLCNRLRQDVVAPQSAPLFELASTRPHYMRDDVNATLGAAAACMLSK